MRLISDRDSNAVVELSGAQIAAAADVQSRSYTLRSSSGGTQKLTLTGLSVHGLLRLAGFDPTVVDFISITRDDGSLATLRHADFAQSPPFPEGPALVTDEGATSRYFRPIRGPGNSNARDNIISATAGPLDITVGGGALLAVRARGRPHKTAVGRTVRFRASVQFPPAGASFTYQWDFGDGTGGVGANATHRYTDEGDYLATVIVEGTGGTGALCQETCGGSTSTSVIVGKRHTSLRPSTQQGSGTANPNGTGASGGGSGSGGSGSGSGGNAGSTREQGSVAPKRRARPDGKPTQRANAGPAITGILLANSPTALKSSLPALSSAGGQPASLRSGARQGAEGGGVPGGSVAVTLALVMIGALYERRRGTLRLA